MVSHHQFVSVTPLWFQCSTATNCKDWHITW